MAGQKGLLHPLARVVGKRLQAIREAKGFTQEELAHKMGVSGPNLYRIESGRQWLQPAQLAAASEILREPMAAFYPGGPPPAPPHRPTPAEALDVLRELIEAIPPDMAQALMAAKATVDGS